MKTERINSYKLALENVAIRFYKVDLSDLTLIGGRPWKDLKEEVCKSEDYESSLWYQELYPDQQEMVQTLKTI